MESVLEFIKANPIQTAIIVLLFIVFILYLFWQLKKKGLRPFIVDFIVKAEEMFNQGQNEEKMNYVIDKIIALVPLPLSLVITRNMVKSIIQNVFDEIKKALDYQDVSKAIKIELQGKGDEE